MSYDAYASLNSLEEIKIIAGSEQVLEFLYYDHDGAAVDLTGLTCKLALCPYGNPDVVSLIKTGVVQTNPTNKFIVTLTTTDTRNLGGKYIQQPIVMLSATDEVRPAQGVITIIPRIRNS